MYVYMYMDNIYFICLCICIFCSIDEDFESVDMNLTFTGAKQEIIVSIPIFNDIIYESPVTFTANLVFITSNVNAELNSSQATITIIDSNNCELLANFSDALSIDAIPIVSLSLSLSPSYSSCGTWL